MKRLARSWLVAGSLTLTLAACGGGGGGGDPKPTAIENDSQAVQAANAVILISSGGIESLSGLVGAKAAKQVVANAQAKFFPQVDLAPLALQRAILPTACVTGTVSYTWVYDENTGDYEETYIYDKCDDGWGAVYNGREHSKRTTVGNKVTEIWVMGNGDDVIQTSDFTITTVSSVQTYSLTAQDVYTITGTDYPLVYSSAFSFKGKSQFKDTDVDVSTLLSVNLSGTDQWTETATKDEGTATLNGSLSVSGKDFGVSFSFKNMKDDYSYSWVSYEETSAPEGTMTVSIQPESCFGGTFNIQTITPITIQNNMPVSGEITINGNTSVSFDNGIITVELDGAPEPAFVGTEEQLAMRISEDCPLFPTSPAVVY